MDDLNQQTKKRDERLRLLLAKNDNVVARDELLAIGFTDHMIHTALSRKRWQQLQHGVYLDGAAPPTWEQRSRAALKGGGTQTVLGAETGLAAWGVDCGKSDVVHVLVQRPHQPRLRDVIVHRTSVADKPRRTPAGLRTASIERLLLDFAASASIDRVEVAVESALTKGLTAERRLWASVAGLSQRMPGVARLTRVLEERPLGKAARSKLEIEIFKVIGRAGLPLPVRNHDIFLDGEHYEIDCAYVEAMRAVECDSRRYHGTASQKRNDRARQAVLESWGWRFCRVTYADVFGRPEWVVEQIRTLLAGAVLTDIATEAGQRARRAG